MRFYLMLHAVTVGHWHRADQHADAFIQMVSAKASSKKDTNIDSALLWQLVHKIKVFTVC